MVACEENKGRWILLVTRFLYSVFRSWDQPIPNYSVDTNVNSWLCSLVNTAALDFLY